MFGVRIRTNDPFHPFILTFAAVLLFVASVGEGRTIMRCQVLDFGMAARAAR